MTRTLGRFVLSPLVALLGLVMAACSAVAETGKPNFIVINVDDLGYADIGPYGATKQRTPNLDRMAAEGRKLMCHYAAPVCSPSRASLMTGCYPKRVLPIPGVLFPAAAVGLHPSERTVAEELKALGYATACIGKWHLGDQPEFLPTRQGFDSYFGIPYSNDMGTAAEGSKSNPGQPIPQRKQVRTPEQISETGLTGMSQPPLPLLENERVLERVGAAEQATLTQRYTEQAVAFVREHKAEPFFLYLPHTAVHFPLYPRNDYRGRSQNGLLGDWIEEVDWSVGQMLDAVRAAGLDRRTLVIFTSDNGGPIQQGANNTPLRGGKGTTLEGGMRACTIAWWPGKVPAGTATQEITATMDVLPTFLSLAGGNVPTDRKLDGRDVSNVILGVGEAKSPHDIFYYYRGFALEAVRSGPWKLHLAKQELYHLGDDIGEAKNLASAHPAEVQRLQAAAEQMRGDLGLTGVGPGCRKLGRVENPLPLIEADGKFREIPPAR